MAYVVIDYSNGNLHSVQTGLEMFGAEVIYSADPKVISRATALVLPGVGAFADASRTMQEKGQMQAVRESVERGTPFLGICLGMQLLFEHGDEGSENGEQLEGLGILKGHVERISSVDSAGVHYKVPHVGWNQVTYTSEAEKCASFAQISKGIEDGSNFYFLHSYSCVPEDESIIMATTTHADTFVAAICKDRVFGVQHHPERSSRNGLEMLKNFVQFSEALKAGDL